MLVRSLDQSLEVQLEINTPAVSTNNTAHFYMEFTVASRAERTFACWKAAQCLRCAKWLSAPSALLRVSGARSAAGTADTGDGSTKVSASPNSRSNSVTTVPTLVAIVVGEHSRESNVRVMVFLLVVRQSLVVVVVGR